MLLDRRMMHEDNYKLEKCQLGIVANDESGRSNPPRKAEKQEEKLRLLISLGAVVFLCTQCSSRRLIIRHFEMGLWLIRSLGRRAHTNSSNTGGHSVTQERRLCKTIDIMTSIKLPTTAGQPRPPTACQSPSLSVNRTT